MASAYKVPFLEAIKIRRSILALAKESPISDERIVMIVNHAIKHAPSPFNVQSARAIVLFGEEHNKFWDFGMQRAKETYPPPFFESLQPKIKGYQDAYGTVLFFDDTTAVEKLPAPLQDLMAKYPDWYEHANGMVQFIAWTALAPRASAATSNTTTLLSTRASLILGTCPLHGPFVHNWCLERPSDPRVVVWRSSLRR